MRRGSTVAPGRGRSCSCSRSSGRRSLPGSSSSVSPTSSTSGSRRAGSATRAWTRRSARSPPCSSPPPCSSRARGRSAPRRTRSTTPAASHRRCARTSRPLRGRSSRCCSSTRRCSAPRRSRCRAPTASATRSGCATRCTARPREARTFHAVYAGFVALGAAAVLVPGIPLGALVTGSQALAAILLPSATVLLLLLGNDAEILGPWVNPAWLNALGTLAVSAMLGLSTALVAHADRPRHRARGRRGHRRCPARDRARGRRRRARASPP